MTCKNCGREYSGNFCPLCGAKNSEACEETKTTPATPEKSKKKTIIIISILVVALIILSLCVFGVINLPFTCDNSSDTTQAETDTPTPETEENGSIISRIICADETEVKITNAKVTAVNTENGKEYSVLTDSAGCFELSVPEGTYSLTVSAEGYEDFIYQNEGSANLITVKKATNNQLDDLIKLKPISADSTEYKHSGFLVTIDDIIYYTNQDGLWKDDGTGSSELLHKCKAENLATNGEYIYYAVYNKDTTAFCESFGQNTTWEQYDLYCYDLKTSVNRKLISFIEEGEPICVYGNKLYYTDRADDFTGDVVGTSHDLYSLDLDTMQKEFISNGAASAINYKGFIYFKALNAAGGNSPVYCFDIEKNTTTQATDLFTLSYDIIGDKMYYTTLKYVTEEASSSVIGNTTTVYEMDLNDNSVKEIFSKTGDISISVNYVDSNYLYYYDHDSKCGYRIDRKTNKEISLGAARMVYKTEDSAILELYEEGNGFSDEKRFGEIKDNEDNVREYSKIYHNVSSVIAVVNDSVYLYRYTYDGHRIYLFEKEDFVRS